MGKSAFDQKPKRDPVKALILEYQNLNKFSDKKAAALIGVSPRTYSHMKNDLHTDDWTPRQYKTLLRKLGVPIDELRAATTYISL